MSCIIRIQLCGMITEKMPATRYRMLKWMQHKIIVLSEPL